MAHKKNDKKWRFFETSKFRYNGTQNHEIFENDFIFYSSFLLKTLIFIPKINFVCLYMKSREN